ncbi:MAG: hypothetical protein EOO93_24050, partial [Pedobacter sp.]
MGLYYILFGLGIFFIVFAIVISVLTIWFRNTAMRIISFIFTLLAFVVYVISIFTIGHADELYGISADRLLYLTIAVPLYLQCYIAMQSASNIVAKKLFFSLASLITLRLLGSTMNTITDLSFRNSLDEFGQLTAKINSYVLFPLFFVGISYFFAKIFHPNLKVFKDLFAKTIVVLIVISICDELLTMLVFYFKYRTFFLYDMYSYLIILAVSLFQVLIGSLIGLYV